MGRGEPADIRESTNALEGFGIISKQQWDEAQAEIDRLKSELELRTKERDQATKNMVIEASYYIVQLSKKPREAVIVGFKDTDPDLYAHLDERGE